MLIFALSLPETALCLRDTSSAPDIWRSDYRGNYRVFRTGRPSHTEYKPGWQARLLFRCPPERKRARPKSNRMPDAAHSVKVEAQVVNCVEDLGKYLVGRIKMPQVSA
jgi:hypothetical protein